VPAGTGRSPPRSSPVPTLPWLVASTHIGVAVDRVSRRAMIVVAHLVHLGVGLVLALLVLTGEASVVTVLLLARSRARADQRAVLRRRSANSPAYGAC
jgi:hypothetical protein